MAAPSGFERSQKARSARAAEERSGEVRALQALVARADAGKTRWEKKGMVVLGESDWLAVVRAVRALR